MIYLIVNSYKMWREVKIDFFLFMGACFLLLGNVIFIIYALHLNIAFLLWFYHIAYIIGFISILFNYISFLTKAGKKVKILSSDLCKYRLLSTCIIMLLIPITLIMVTSIRNTLTIGILNMIVWSAVFFFLAHLETITYMTYRKDIPFYIKSDERTSLKDFSFVEMYVSLINMYLRIIKDYLSEESIKRVYKYVSLEVPILFSPDTINKDFSINTENLIKNAEKISSDLRESAVGNALKLLSESLINEFSQISSEYLAKKYFGDCYARIKTIYEKSPEFKTLLKYMPKGIAEEDKALIMEKDELVEEYIEKLRKFKEVENIYRILYSTAGVGIVITDSRGYIIDANDEFLRLIKLSAGSVRGKGLFELFKFISEKDYNAMKNIFKELLNGAEKASSKIHVNIHEERKTFDMVSTPLKDDYGNIITVIHIIYDLTEIERTEENLKASLREKELLLQEVHHRVKNNLQIIISLLNLNIRSLNDENAKRIFKESIGRIRTISLIHEKLYLSKNFEMIDFAEYIKSLVYHIYSSNSVDARRIKPVISIDNIKLNITQAIPCALIVNELITNSLKHAFPENEEGKIWIKMWREGDNFIMEIGDTGIGMPPNHRENSIGMMIVESLVQQLNGEIAMRKGKGTVYIIKFPAKLEGEK